MGVGQLWRCATQTVCLPACLFLQKRENRHKGTPLLYLDLPTHAAHTTPALLTPACPRGNQRQDVEPTLFNRVELPAQCKSIPTYLSRGLFPHELSLSLPTFPIPLVSPVSARISHVLA